MNWMLNQLLVGMLIATFGLSNLTFAQEKDDDSKKEKVYSGPQVGEKLASFKIKQAHGENEGKSIDPVKAAGDKPVVLVFIHERSRPAFGLSNIVMRYCNEHKDRLSPYICYLADDPVEAQNWLSRVKNYFPKGTPVGVADGGQDGPGAYGLNRNVALTVLVGDKGKVVANFAMVQPGAQVDGPKILQAIAKSIGEKDKPELAKYLPNQGRNNARMNRMDPELGKLVRSLVAQDATEEKITETIEAINKMVENRKQLKTQLGQIAKRFVDSGRVNSVGNEKHRSQIREWVKLADETPKRGEGGRPGANRKTDDKLTGMLRSLIQKSNSDEQVDKIAKSIEAYVETSKVARSEIARISKTIAGSDRLGNYGTEHCQEILKKWARKYNDDK